MLLIKKQPRKNLVLKFLHVVVESRKKKANLEKPFRHNSPFRARRTHARRNEIEI